MTRILHIILPCVVLAVSLACAGANDPPKMLAIGMDANSRQVPAEVRESFITIPPVYKFPLGAPTSTISGNVVNYRVRQVTLDEFAIMNCEVTTQMYVDFLNSAVPATDATGGGTASTGGGVGRETFYNAAMMNDYLCGIYRTDSKGGLVDVQGTGTSTVNNSTNAGDNFLFKAGTVDPFQEGVGRLKGRQQATTSGADGGYKYHVTTGRNRFPATFVSQADAVGFAQWLGVQYRLPTEDEWELAAKGRNPAVEFPTTPSAMPSSDTVANFQAQFHALANFQGEFANPLWPTRVKSFAPNSAGLYDMAGNVWEWTGNSAFSTTAATSSSSSGGSSGDMYLKGGSWNSRLLQELAVWYHHGPIAGTSRVSDLGFRLVFTTKSYPATINLAVTGGGNTN